MRVLAAAILLAAPLAAQDDPLLELAGRARAAPPEFAADLLIRLAERPESPIERRIEWLEDAFRLAQGARRKTPGLLSAHSINLALHIMPAQISGMRPAVDTLTLQSRAVQSLLPLDPARATILLRSIQVPLATSTQCDAPPQNLATYFGAVEAVYKRGFSEAERAEGRDLDFLISVVSRVQSRAGLEGSINYFRLLLDAAAYSRLLDAFTAALRSVRPDGFGSVGDLSHSLIPVIDRTLERHLPVFPLFSAVREYLVAAFRARRCAGPRLPPQTLPPEAKAFNDTLLAYGGPETAQIRPIEARELQPALSLEARVPPLQPSPRLVQLMASIDRLGDPSKGTQISPEFENSMRDLLRQADQWRRDHAEPEEVYVTLAAGVYKAMTSAIHSDTLRRTVIRSHLDLLVQTPLRNQDPQSWAAAMDGLVNPIRVNDIDLDWFREELRASGEQLISLYLETYELLSRPSL